MIDLKHTGLIALSLVALSATSCQKTDIDAGAIMSRFGTADAAQLPAEPDPDHFAFPRPRGQVKFNVPLEKNFVPTPAKYQKPINSSQKPKADLVPNAIDSHASDYGRNTRIDRLVR